jgi:hypothetical protein
VARIESQLLPPRHQPTINLEEQLFHMNEQLQRLQLEKEEEKRMM